MGKHLFLWVFPWCLSRVSNIHFLFTLRYSNMVCGKIPPFSSGISIASHDQGNSHLLVHATWRCGFQEWQSTQGKKLPNWPNWPNWPFNLEMCGVLAVLVMIGGSAPNGCGTPKRLKSLKRFKPWIGSIECAEKSGTNSNRNVQLAPTYVYMYICIYVHMYICIYVYMYICIYVYMYTCVYVNLYIRIYVYLYICIYVYMCICVYVYMSISLYVYMHICIHVYMYTCVYVNLYIRIYVYLYICIYVYAYICL